MNRQAKSNRDRFPLQGVKVLDFSIAFMGPDLTRTLSAFGAEVIKVESIHQHELTRVSAPFKDNVVGINRSFVFAAMNTGKHGITLNLKHPRSAEVVKRLITWADIVVENFVPGSVKKYGLDYEQLRELKPDIIVLSLSAQGATGPYSRHPGYGFNLLALCGFSHLTGWPDHEASVPVGAYTDFILPWFAIAAILSALDYRLRTGKGQHIEGSQLEISPQFLIPAILDYTANGRVQTRCGNRSSSASPHGAFRCRGNDRWCVIAVSSDEEWETFCRVIGSPEWTKDRKFNTLGGRKDNEDELDKLVEAWTVLFTPEEVMTRMQAPGVASGVVQSIKDVVNDPQLEHRGTFRILEHPELGAHICENLAFRLSKCKVEWKRPAPCLGEHNEFVYTKLLGMSEEEFVELLNDGVFE